MILKQLLRLNIFQKINYYLIFFLSLSSVIVLIGFSIDFYEKYISKTWNNESISKGWTFVISIIAFNLIFVFPNTFTIYVYEMRKHMIPKIPQWYNLIKNVILILLIIGIYIPLIIYPLLNSQDPSSSEIITKQMINSRYSNLPLEYGNIWVLTLIATIFLIPIWGIINWVHAIIWKGGFKLKGK
ncbi:hypothetical protein [Aquirufa aurantiipilula]|uniref:hypothetical protein n=1 Tax=Aquirufa aurantiipilula TaxID=2696561 RepID=UPI001CAA4CEF|nr:hypothetical protein [Aquirufa aurantiipilula]MBZ1327015.1 hypothetical protein [Aquirufa aurantiipilula]